MSFTNVENAAAMRQPPRDSFGVPYRLLEDPIALYVTVGSSVSIIQHYREADGRESA